MSVANYLTIYLEENSLLLTSSNYSNETDMYIINDITTTTLSGNQTYFDYLMSTSPDVLPLSVESINDGIGGFISVNVTQVQYSIDGGVNYYDLQIDADLGYYYTPIGSEEITATITEVSSINDVRYKITYSGTDTGGTDHEILYILSINENLFSSFELSLLNGTDYKVDRYNIDDDIVTVGINLTNIEYFAGRPTIYLNTTNIIIAFAFDMSGCRDTKLFTTYDSSTLTGDFTVYMTQTSYLNMYSFLTDLANTMNDAIIQLFSAIENYGSVNFSGSKSGVSYDYSRTSTIRSSNYDTMTYFTVDTSNLSLNFNNAGYSYDNIGSKNETYCVPRSHNIQITSFPKINGNSVSFLSNETTIINREKIKFNSASTGDISFSTDFSSYETSNTIVPENYGLTWNLKLNSYNENTVSNTEDYEEYISIIDNDIENIDITNDGKYNFTLSATNDLNKTTEYDNTITVTVFDSRDGVFETWDDLLLTNNYFVRETTETDTDGNTITTYTLQEDLILNDNITITSVDTPATIPSNTVFDGNNHTITIDSDFSTTFYGLFITTATVGVSSTYPENITIKNIGVLGSNISTGCGSICSEDFGLYAKGDITIQNCYADGIIPGNGSNIVGQKFCSYVGYYASNDTTINITISECRSLGNRNSSDTITSGILAKGSCNNLCDNCGENVTVNVIIEKCSATEDIATATSAGIVSKDFCSYAMNDAGANTSCNISVKECLYTGNIPGNYSGGIIGPGSFSNTYNSSYSPVYFNITIENCVSTGDIEGFAGAGIIGQYFCNKSIYSNDTTLSDVPNTEMNINIKNCYSSGDVTGSKANGIVGRYFLNNTLGINSVTVENIYDFSGNYDNLDTDNSTSNNMTSSYSGAEIADSIDTFKSNIDYTYWNILVYPPELEYFTPSTYKIIASSSGDPHIFPLIGNMFELPNNKNGIYRMLQSKKNDIILNASTKKVTANQKNDIIAYVNDKYNKNRHMIDENDINNIITNGVFYDSIYLCSEGVNKLWFNFNTQKVEMSKKGKEYFKLKITRQYNDIYENKYESSEIINNLSIQFVHSNHGKLTVDLNFFSNPQIRYGVGFSGSKNTITNIDGLLIREYLTQSMACEHIEDTMMKKGKKGKNKITSKFSVIDTRHKIKSV